jgi:membrane protease subunit HflK
MASRSSSRLGLLGSAAAVALYAATGLYSVASDESAIAFRFGEAIDRNVLPGIHWNAPRPFGRVIVAKTATSFVMPIGYRFLDRPEQAPISPLWLTGDTNVVSAKMNVQYSIKSLADFELGVESPRELLRKAGESALTDYFGGQAVDGLLTTERQRAAERIRDSLQSTLDRVNAGIEIQSVNVEELAPPEEGAVRSAFQEVQNASADRERTIYEAGAYRAQILAAAEGESRSMRAAAAGARYARIETARGRAERFSAIAAEHARAPEITEERIYLETLDRILPAMATYVVDPGTDGKVNLRVLR